MKQIAPLEVGLAVRQLEPMLAFYVAVLGCVEERRAEIPGALSQAIGVAPNGYVNVWLKTPNGEVIKLVQPPDAPSGEASVFSADVAGFRYLTFYCEDLAGVLAKAEAAGARVRSDASGRDGSLGVKLVFFEDPEGNVIELVEPVT